MTDKQPEALRLADALENDGNDCTCAAYSSSECGCDAVWADSFSKQAAAELRRLHEVNESLKARLAQPEPVATGFIRTLVEVGEGGIETWKNEPFYTDPPQQKTKIHDCPRCHCHFMDSGEILSQTHDGKSWRDNPQFHAKVGAQPEPEPEPVAWINQINGTLYYMTEWDDVAEPDKILKPLYTAPPQREWKGLTAEQIASIPRDEYMLQKAERLLKENNT